MEINRSERFKHNCVRNFQYSAFLSNSHASTDQVIDIYNENCLISHFLGTLHGVVKGFTSVLAIWGWNTYSNEIQQPKVITFVNRKDFIVVHMFGVRQKYKVTLQGFACQGQYNDLYDSTVLLMR